MALFTNEAIAHVRLRAGLNALREDLHLLEQYKIHATGCGLESLDNTSGKLIEQGLAARYPNHFEMGSGLEGITALIGKIKDGIAGIMKKMKESKKAAAASENNPPKKQVKPDYLASEVKKTYGNAAWVKALTLKEGDINVAALSKLVGDAENLPGYLSNIDKIITDYGKAFKTCESETDSVWKKFKPWLAKAEAAGEDESKIDAVAAQIRAANLPDPYEIENKVPEVKAGSNTTMAIISHDDLVKAGAKMVELVEFGLKLLIDAEEYRTDDHGFGTDVYMLPDDLVNLLCDGYWEPLCAKLDELAEKGEERMLFICQALESVFISASK